MNVKEENDFNGERQCDNDKGNKYATTMLGFDRKVQGRGEHKLCIRMRVIHTTIAERGKGLGV